MAGTVILGGGVIGASVAYYLSRAGINSTIIERRSIASGASGTAAGLLSPPSPAELREPQGRLATKSLALHFELAHQLDGAAQYGFEPLDTALISRNEGERAALLAEYGTDAWLEPEQLAEQCRWLAGAGIGGVTKTGGAQLDPLRFTETLIEESGAEVLPDSAEGLVTAGGRVQGVRLGAVTLPCDAVVIAMGPWSGAAATWLGTSLPVSPLKGQILRLNVPDAPPGGFSDADGNYLVRKPTGLTYTGTTEEDAGFNESPTAEVADRLLAQAHRLAPLTTAATVVERTACLRPLSADGLPMIGAAPGLDGAYIATGHGRKGILLAPATGLALAELVTAGSARSVDLAPFSPSRFMPE